MSRRRSGEMPPASALADRLEWLRQARSGEEEDAALLVSGLREDDPHRWEIGVVHAWVEIDLSDGSPSVWLRFVKPNKRTEAERTVGEIRLDPEAAFLFQMHALFAGSLCLTWSTSYSEGRIYHYPRVLLPGSPFRFLRMIGNTPASRIPQIGRDNWRDMRRRNFIVPITNVEADVRHGPQNRRANWDRPRAILASSAFHRPLIDGIETPTGYADALREVYALLDSRRPLGKP